MDLFTAAWDWWDWWASRHTVSRGRVTVAPAAHQQSFTLCLAAFCSVYGFGSVYGFSPCWLYHHLTLSAAVLRTPQPTNPKQCRYD